MVVEYMEGGTLEKYRGTAIEVQKALQYVLAVADGLEDLHREGLVHRDVKPSNIGLTRSGAIKLLDFGLVREMEVGLERPPERSPQAAVLTSSDTTASYQAGTPLYLPPECWEGRAVAGVDQDLWALSMVFYELAVGRHLLRSESVWREETLVYSVIRERMRRREGCPQALAPLLATALSLNPSERPRDMRAWKQLMRETFAGTG